MHCCEKCFKDSELKAIVCTNKTKGKCDFCGSNNVHIYDLNNNSDLQDSIESLLDVYTPVSEMGKQYPPEQADLLKNILNTKWHIFNLSADGIYKFLREAFPEKYKEQPSLFDNPIGIAENIDKEYLQKFSILGCYQWEDFVTEIKGKNRFHTNIINKTVLKDILQIICKPYKAGTKFYRARIWNDKNGYKKKEMGAPPALKASAGRANPEGISCLYLANTIETTLHEIRAGLYDNATVATFKLLEDIEVVNLAAIDKISPFQEINSTLLAINMPHLEKIGNELSKPLRRRDSSLDYLPTQYISDYIKSEGFAGIEYKSTMHKNGVNFAIFDEELFKCINTESYDITELNYKYTKNSN